MKHIRDKLGLSQTELAGLLEMPKGTFSLYELGLRNLNSRQLATIAEIELLLQEEQTIDPASAISISADQLQAAMLKKMGQRLEKVSFECIKLNRKLLELQNNYIKNRRLWGLITNLKAKTPAGTRLMAYLGLLELQCLEKSERFGLDKQTGLTFKINLLAQEQKLLQEIISANGLTDSGLKERVSNR